MFPARFISAVCFALQLLHSVVGCNSVDQPNAVVLELPDVLYFTAGAHSQKSECPAGLLFMYPEYLYLRKTRSRLRFRSTEYENAQNVAFPLKKSNIFCPGPTPLEYIMISLYLPKRNARGAPVKPSSRSRNCCNWEPETYHLLHLLFSTPSRRWTVPLKLQKLLSAELGPPSKAQTAKNHVVFSTVTFITHLNRIHPHASWCQERRRLKSSIST